MCFHFSYTVQVDPIIKKFFTTHAYFYVMEFRKQKNIF